MSKSVTVYFTLTKVDFLFVLKSSKCEVSSTIYSSMIIDYARIHQLSKDNDFISKILERNIESVKDTLDKPFTYERQTKSLTNPSELYRIL